MLNHRLAIVTAFVLLSPPAPAAQDEAAAKNGSGPTLALAGTIHGTFTATRSNPDSGVAYELTGSGQVPPLGECKASGRFNTLGFVITGRSTGQLTLMAPQGGVTLSLTGPEQRGFSPPPDCFDYRITGGTGAFGSASGSGSVGLTLRQSAGAEANPAEGLKSQKGEFTLSFGPAGRGGRAVALRTAYLGQPIDRFHRLSLDGELGGKGRLSLDPNGCAVTEFGDTGICTLIAATVRDVTLRQEPSPDPTGAGRRLYQIEGAGLAAPLRLVTPPASGSGAYRLVYGAGDASRVVVVTLESTASATGTPPGGGSANGGGGVAPANQKRGSVERLYEGQSDGGTLQEALDGALQKLDTDLSEGGVADAIASWRLLDVSGVRGGFSGSRSVKVRIAATRTPPWTK